MSGQELWDDIFADEIEKWGELNPHELEDDVEDITCYKEEYLSKDGWYINYLISFKWKGIEYSIEKRKHSSDNVCDTNWFMETFKEVRNSKVYKIYINNGWQYSDEEDDIKLIVAYSKEEANIRAESWMKERFGEEGNYNKPFYYVDEIKEIDGFKISVNR